MAEIANVHVALVELAPMRRGVSVPCLMSSKKGG
jgi:hypothetical protein